jgi:hypothetical protein
VSDTAAMLLAPTFYVCWRPFWMKNLRTYTMTIEEQANFDPAAFTEKLKAAGFKLDSEQCPVKITRPFDRVATPDGVVIWRQWDGDQ